MSNTRRAVALLATAGGLLLAAAAPASATTKCVGVNLGGHFEIVQTICVNID